MAASAGNMPALAAEGRFASLTQVSSVHGWVSGNKRSTERWKVLAYRRI